MWIRSQDGLGLYKVDMAIVEYDATGAGINTYHGGEWVSLGEYTSEFEALKVLDLIVTQHDMDVYEHGPEGMRVFQMPKKGWTA